MMMTTTIMKMPLLLLLLLGVSGAGATACAAGSFWAPGAPLDFSTAPAATTNQASSWKNLPACKLTTLNAGGGWCANTTLDGNTKFQLTLPANSYVYGIGIQGRADADEWITSAELFYRPSTETYVSGGVLARTSADRSTITRFNTYFVAQIVYLLIRGVNNWPSLRANLYVAPSAACSPCPAGTYSSAAESQGCIPCPAGTYSSAGASACTACASGATIGGGATVVLPTLFVASQWDNSPACQTPALYGAGAWCPGAASDAAVSPHFLILNVGGATQITRISTQGAAGTGQYVTSYNVYYANTATPATTWTRYGTVALTGNADDTSVVTNTLSSPITAHYVKLVVVSASAGGIAMRAGLHGVSGAQACSPGGAPTC